MITRKMKFCDILENNSKAAEILSRHGMHCCMCHMAGDETLEEGCKTHGLDSKKIDKIVEELNA